MLLFEFPIHHKRFKKFFPGWNALIKNLSKKRLSSEDVRKIVGVTKQQLDYWMVKGIIPFTERDPQKWRKFSLLDLLAIAVVHKFRCSGLEVSKINEFKNRLLARGLWNFNEPLAYLINGWKVFLFVELEGAVTVIPFNPEDDEKDQSKLSELIRDETSFLAGISLNKVCERLIKKLNLPDFKVTIDPLGKYKFFIGTDEVPLALEPLDLFNNEDLKRKFFEANENLTEQRTRR